MKKAKKLLAMVMVCIFVLGAVQPTAFAGLFDRKISDVEISINNAIAGYFVDEYEQYIEIKSKGIIFDNTVAQPLEVLYNSGLYPKEGSPMKLGETYVFKMRFMADKGYTFKEDSIKNLDVAGGRVTEYGVKYASDSETYYLEIRCVVEIKEAKTVPVKQLDIELNSKIAGITAKYQDNLVKTNTEEVRLSLVVCSKKDFSEDIYYSEYDGKFEIGKTYYFRLYFTASGGYDASNLEKVIVNGKEYSNWKIQYPIYLGSYKQIMVEIPITVDGNYGKSIEELSFTFDKRLDDIEIKVKDIADFIKVDTEHVEITKVVVVGIHNFGDKDTFLVNYDGRFWMEQIYRMTIYVKADEGYTFNGLKKVVINGEDITKSENGYANVVDTFGVVYDFIPQEVELTFFEKVARFFKEIFSDLFWFLY